MGTTWKDGYSAEVNLYLVIGDEALDVAQVGPAFLVLAEPRNIDECYAEIVVEVDGKQTRYPVAIDGAYLENPTVNYVMVKESKSRPAQARQSPPNHPMSLSEAQPF